MAKKKKEINWKRWHWLRQHLKKAQTTQLPEEPQAKITNFLATIFAAAPIITAAIYLSGMAYQAGEYHIHGLNTSEFPWPADFTLAWGYMQWLDFSKVYLWPLLLYFIPTVLPIIVILIFNVRLRLRWAWHCHQFFSMLYPKVTPRFNKAARIPTPKMFLFFSWLKIFYDRIAILVLPILITLTPALYSLNEGLDAAKLKVQELEAWELDTSPKNEASAKSSLLDKPHIRLACNTTHCAYRLKGGVVKLLRHDQVELVQWTPDQMIDN